MNLISCDGCGVVFDKSKLNFPDDLFDEEDEYDPAYAKWDQMEEKMDAYVTCRICGEDIFRGRE